jgi:hypothetical protein
MKTDAKTKLSNQRRLYVIASGKHLLHPVWPPTLLASSETLYLPSRFDYEGKPRRTNRGWQFQEHSIWLLAQKGLARTYQNPPTGCDYGFLLTKGFCLCGYESGRTNLEKDISQWDCKGVQRLCQEVTPLVIQISI